MQLFTRLLWRARRPARAQVCQRAARVLEKAMFDVGIDNFLNGTVLLDKRLRPRFFSATSRRTCAGVATVVLAQLEEARALQALADGVASVANDANEANEANEHARRRQALLDGVIREFHAQCPAFRSLR